MKGKTLVRIGSIWLLVIIIFLGIPFLVPFLAYEFFGLGIELPFPVEWFGIYVGFAIFRVLGYGTLLGWIPFVLIGTLRLRRERASRK